MSISRSVDRRHIGTIIWSVDRRRIGAIGIVVAGIAALSVVDGSGSTVPAQGRFRRQIGTESYCRVSSQAYRREILSGS